MVRFISRREYPLLGVKTMDHRALLKKYIAFVTRKHGGVAILPMSWDQSFDPQEIYELHLTDEEILDDEGRPPLLPK